MSSSSVSDSSSQSSLVSLGVLKVLDCILSSGHCGLKSSNASCEVNDLLIVGSNLFIQSCNVCVMLLSKAVNQSLVGINC